MELISLGFILFVLVLLAAYYAVGRFARRGQWVVLLVASLTFYCLAGSWTTLVFVVATSLATWLGGLGLARLDELCDAERKQVKDREERRAIKARYLRRKRLVLAGALVVALGILGYLKYWETILAYFNASGHVGLAVLPLGLSFYTFSAVSYLIDLHNSKYAPERSFWRYLLFVTYFPQLIQGPINRYNQMAPQLLALHEPDVHGMRAALLRIGYGVLKVAVIAKIVGADVDAIFYNVTEGIPGSVALYGILCYSIQMYASFSGGIDLVEGVSELLGIRMHQNFRQPYLSTSLADFWRRWHMSLGTWMRDYAFYPLALTRPFKRLGKWADRHLGKHVGRILPAAAANVVVFLMVGLWHGAQPHYVAWGLYNGVIIALADLLAPTFSRLNERLHVRTEGFLHHSFVVVRTFLLVNIGRYFDRITDLGDCFTALYNTVFNFMPMPFDQALALYGVDSWAQFGISKLVVAACLVVVVVDLCYERGIDVRERILAWHPLARIALYVVCAGLICAALPLIINQGTELLYAIY